MNHPIMAQGGSSLFGKFNNGEALEENSANREIFMEKFSPQPVKRKRKHTIPQRFEHPNSQRGGVGISSTRYEVLEPMNLSNKSLNAFENCCRKSTPSTEFPNTSLDVKPCDPLLSTINEIINSALSQKESNGFHQDQMTMLILEQLLMKLYPFNERYSFLKGLIDSYSTCSMIFSPQPTDASIKKSESISVDIFKSISQTISSCTNSLPKPIAGFNNFDEVNMCYENLLSELDALNKSIGNYLSLWQSSRIPTPVKKINKNGLHQDNSEIEKSSCHINSSHDELIALGSTHISSKVDSKKQNGKCLNGDQCLLFGSRNGQGPFSTSVQSFQFQDVPVDLTKTNDNNAIDQYNFPQKQSFDITSDKICVQSNPLSEQYSKNKIESFEKAKTYQPNDFDSTHPSVSQKCPNPMNGQIQPLSYQSATLSSMRHKQAKKKPFFRNKINKKSFSSGLTHIDADYSEGAMNKKSNFRGTSEEENRISLDFKPIEREGKVILTDVYPNVSLPNDAFYSLIVKSSGSATRLIRLLMKSFFSQVELAASSLSGEGIYKQRLEPSVTDAIKIFIRNRHPQLKTGSINLCMTDVCVQARRVANNQRSRQHPYPNYGLGGNNCPSYTTSPDSLEGNSSIATAVNGINNTDSDKPGSSTSASPLHNHHISRSLNDASSSPSLSPPLTSVTTATRNHHHHQLPNAVSEVATNLPLLHRLTTEADTVPFNGVDSTGAHNQTCSSSSASLLPYKPDNQESLAAPANDFIGVTGQN